MNIIRHTLIAALTAAAAIASHAQTWESAPRKGFVSWQPAAKWEDALLTGNGTLGAMVMGRPFDETIILNHALLFWPGDQPAVPPDMSADLDTIRRLCYDGKWKEAARYHIDKWREAGLGEKRWTDGYVPAADLDIQSEPSNIVRYQRLTNYETGENTVNWQDAQGVHTRSVFASRSGNVVVVSMRGEGRINSTFELKRHPHSWELWSQMNERSHHRRPPRRHADLPHPLRQAARRLARRLRMRGPCDAARRQPQGRGQRRGGDRCRRGDGGHRH